MSALHGGSSYSLSHGDAVTAPSRREPCGVSVRGTKICLLLAVQIDAHTFVLINYGFALTIYIYKVIIKDGYMYFSYSFLKHRLQVRI